MVLSWDNILSNIYRCHRSYRGILFQLEINPAKKISGFLNILAWIHILGMNIRGPLATILMIFAGLAGSGILSVFTEGNIG